MIAVIAYPPQPCLCCNILVKKYWLSSVKNVKSVYMRASFAYQLINGDNANKVVSTRDHLILSTVRAKRYTIKIDSVKNSSDI